MYYLGIDGGGTKTTAVLSDVNGEIIRMKKYGAGNISVLGKEKITLLLHDILNSLLENDAAEKVRWATFAFAGAGRVEEKEAAKNIISELGIKNFTILTDAELLFYSVHGEGHGILISSGTGSICIVRNNKNELEQLGGWGYLLGDEGSGFDVGRNAIRAAIDMDDKAMPSSQLTRKLLSFYQIQHPKELITKVYQTSNPQRFIASCAQLVCEQASQGESTAKKVIHSAADALFRLCLRGIERMDTMPPYKIALAGGVLYENSPVVKDFKKKVELKQLNFHYINQQIEPAAAGVLYSVGHAGEPLSNELTKKMRNVRFY